MDRKSKAHHNVRGSRVPATEYALTRKTHTTKYVRMYPTDVCT
jgi:hypothetical protein